MSEQRSLTADLFALALLVSVAFLGVALITYDPADPIGEPNALVGAFYKPDILVYPVNETIRNACGLWGAISADLLFNLFGAGAYYLVVSLAIVDYFLLRRHEIDTPLVRAAGWLVSFVGFSALVALALPGLSVGPAIGAGGHLGALACSLLEMHFATMGSLILAISLIVGGLLLCTDYALLRALQAAAGLPLLAARRLFVTLPRRKPKKARVKNADQVEDPIEEMDDDGELVTVKFPKRPASDIADDELEYLDAAGDAEQDDDEAAAVEEVKQPAVVKRRGNARADQQHSESGLKIRKPLDKSERQRVMSSLDQAAVGDEDLEYALPSLDLLLPGEEFCFDEQEQEVRRKAKVLEKTFADFGFRVKVVEVETGPVIAQYEVELEAGLRLSKITGLADDLAIALRVPSVRIVAPIPGKNTVGIEVPNEQRQVVRLREVIEEGATKTQKMRIPLFLGKDVSGNPLIADLSTLPHLLIAGRTGTGKSVCLNAIISSILMTRRPDEVRMLMIDPKMVELSGYGRLPHLMHPVVTDMRKAEAILAWAVDKMEERYALLARAGVRHISSYNQLDEDELMARLDPETDEERASIPLRLPFIVIVADEMADLMMTSGKEVEQHIIRLAQKSRAVGIHLILATQKPTVDVITGLIKSNLPARISFQVASRTDSRVVLDEMGADKLLGNGDMLFLWPGTSTLLRGQGTYMDDDEIDRVVDFVSTGEQNFVHELVNMKVEEGDDAKPGQLEKRDELYETAVDTVVREGRGSVSLLQRAMGIGYGRAARLIDYMAEDGIVGPYAGSQAREVLLSVADWERMQGQDAQDEGEERAGRSRGGRTLSLRAEQSEPLPSDAFDLLEDDEDYDETGDAIEFTSRYSE
jgi:S-DNA-T family DNA segregation ATPase FtsK/SpoIIIE